MTAKTSRTTGTNAAAAGSLPCPRDRAKALLAFRTERRLTAGTGAQDGVHPTSSDGVRLLDAWSVGLWDAWWICFRSASPASALGLDFNAIHREQIEGEAIDGECATCWADAARLAEADPPAHPDQLGARTCGCLADWAVAMRSGGPEPAWPGVVVTVAMVKPGADRAAVRARLEMTYSVGQVIERRLDVADVRRLYPDAYGAEYVAHQDAYLTSEPVQVLILVAKSSWPPDPKRVKLALRRSLGGTDPLRNHVHMPDSPGDTWCDLAHLAGHDVLADYFERYERDRAAHRLAQYQAMYRAVLGEHPAHTGRQ